MFRQLTRSAAEAVLFIGIVAGAVPAWGQTRGELLYATHCGACHTTQMHWRDRKKVVDWASLRQEVRQWQDVARLGWSDDDIEQVARYLNDQHYRLPAPAGQGVVALAQSRWPGPPTGRP
ncbi:MAG: cytochrome C [Rubrivivax sp.]|jgi:mono/diheme cytochrome c family protein